ncbi:hypothetical protein NMY22_g13696 [Coprinellus aureogranulatus]|nr:hypothetical protein NMY22_g13696 [Coprinellus aureogranulatus]
MRHSATDYGRYYQERAMSPVSAVGPYRSPSPFRLHTQQPTVNFFPDAHNFNIEHQSIKVSHNVQQAPPKTVFEHLEPYVSHGAAHNSDERCDAPKCSPETREAIQGELVGLIRDGDVHEPSKRMTWLGGPAGAGKTAIAGSVAVTCAELGLLAASFFFSSVLGSGHTRRTKSCVITTLAYQLALHDVLHAYKVELAKAIKRSPDIFRKSLLDQALCLILGPLRAIHGLCDTTTWPRGILLDGLDEVKAVQYHDTIREDLVRTDEDDQLEILHVLFALAKSPVFPFRIFVCSRPEDNIAHFFATAAQASTVVLFLDSKYDPDADIKRFLQSRFAEIQRRSGISDSSWPGEEIIDQIVDISSGQFIVPSTILRYVGSGLPLQQLEDIMRVGRRAKKGRKNPWALLDALYTHIIDRSPDPCLVVTWMRCVTFARSPAISAYFWRAFFEDTDGEFHHLLTPLASLLSIPPHEDRYSPIKIYHKSLTDFLASRVRAGKHYVEEGNRLEFSAARYLVVLRYRGPKISLRSSDELNDFIQTLSSLTLFPTRTQVGSGGYCQAWYILHHSLCKPHIVTLAVCDVAWWTRVMLALGERRVAEGMTLLGYHPIVILFGGLYCHIHSSMCMSNGSEDTCHAACIHWRKCTLDEAQALGWCVHKLQEVPVEQLCQLHPEEFEQRFRKFGNGLECTFCQAAPDRQVQLGSRQHSSVERRGWARVRKTKVLSSVDISSYDFTRL